MCASGSVSTGDSVFLRYSTIVFAYLKNIQRHAIRDQSTEQRPGRDADPTSSLTESENPTTGP